MHTIWQRPRATHSHMFASSRVVPLESVKSATGKDSSGTSPVLINCCYGNLLCHKITIIALSNGWAFMQYHYCGIIILLTVVIFIHQSITVGKALGTCCQPS